jgi:hypothetical protein
VSYEITVTLGEDAPLGFVSAPIEVHTDHPTAKTVIIKLIATVRSGG